MPITIRDIAAMAKVSKGTVSKVLNEAPGVGARTRKGVLDLIKRLDYSTERRGAEPGRTPNREHRGDRPSHGELLHGERLLTDRNLDGREV